MSDTPLRDMARDRRLKVGTFVVEFSTPGIGHALAAADCEFVVLDMEHSGFGIETVKRMLRYFEAAALPSDAVGGVGGSPRVVRATHSPES